MRNLLAATTALTLSLAIPGLADTHAAEPFNYQHAGTEIMGSSFIGARVYVAEEDVQEETTWSNWTGGTDDWKDIGEIHDILMTRDGMIEAILVDVGGFLGIGEKQVSVDMEKLRLVSDGDEADEYFVVFSATREALEGAPAYNDDGGRDVVMATGSEETTEAYTSPKMAPDGFAPVSVDNITTEMLTGARVYDANDNWIGEVDKLNLADGGKIDEAIIDVGGFLGIGEKQVSMKFDGLNVQQETDGDEVRVYLDATKDALMEMPEYEG